MYIRQMAGGIFNVLHFIRQLFMKKILFLFLLLVSIERTNAQTISITKVTAIATTSYSGSLKDTILQNNARITSNLLPIAFLKFNVKWEAVIIDPSEPQYVVISLYDAANNTNLYSMTLYNVGAKDSTLISWSPNFASSPVGNTYNFYVRVTHNKNASTVNIDERSTFWQCKFVDDPNKIMNNKICCSKIVTLPYLPTDSLTRDLSVDSTKTATKLSIKYIWERSIDGGAFLAVPGATNASYLPARQTYDTYYRRVAIAYKGATEINYDISNTVSLARQTCARPTAIENVICGDQGFYNLVDGDIIDPTKIIGSYIPWPSDADRHQGYEYLISYGGDWYTQGGITELYGSLAKPSDFKKSSITFYNSNGPVQYVYIQRKYYELYDDWSCDFIGIPHPCGKKWHLKSISNTVTLTLTSLNPPKPVADSITNETGYDFASCSYSAQTMTFSVPRVNNNETYKWEIPAGWIAYTALEGPYVNSITISTNSGGANYAIGGNVCLTIKQPGQINSMCRYIQGSEPFSVNLPAVLTGCEGSDVVVTPVVLQNNVAQSLTNYGFHWEAYQSPNTECIPQSTKYDNGCRQLKINISNVYQNPVQLIKVTATNNHACSATATTNLTTVPGLQMGILNSFDDPKVNSTSNLALNEPSDQLYFTAANGNIQRAYFDDNINQNIWRYAELKDKNTNAPISATGSLAFYRTITSDRLFYVYSGNIYYAETIDNGVTWTNVKSNPLASNASSRIKISGDNMYYIDGTSNKVFYKSLTGTAAAVLVGNATINYSQDMFAVEEGILAYADQNNNIVVFDALTGAVLPVTIAANLKAVTYNSAISIYNKNIYYVTNTGVNNAAVLRILQRSSTSTSYAAYQDVASQLAGPFTINRQTGTVYAKAYDVAGKQIYFLNNQWTITPVKNYLQGSPIQSSMVYGNGHAFYIGSNGLLSNTFYVAPCIPNVLRTSGNTNMNNGDPSNDPIPVTREEIPALILYPNPAKNLVHINFAVEKASNIQIRMVSLTGNTYTLLSTSVEEGAQDIELPLEAYAAGTYLVQLYVEGALSASSKLVIY
jgi:hypothetical protein